MQRDVLWVNNSNLVRVQKLRNLLTASYLNDAEVSVTVLDESGAQVAGETWPKAMNYEIGTEGSYLVSLSPALAITDGQMVTLRVNATQSTITARWDIPMLCLTRAND